MLCAGAAPPFAGGGVGAAVRGGKGLLIVAWLIEAWIASLRFISGGCLIDGSMGRCATGRGAAGAALCVGAE